MHNITAVRIIQYHVHHQRRRSVLDISRNRIVYTSKKLLSSKSNKSVSNNDAPSTTAAASKFTQLFDSLTSTASDVVSKATKKATQAASEATDVATTKAKTAATKATNNLRHSITNAKIDAKKAGEQYAWDAHRSISKMGENMKQSAKVATKKTSEHMKETISNVSQSATNRLRDEISQRIRIPEIPKLSFVKKKKQPEAISTPTSSSTPKSTTVDAPSCESKKVIPNNYSLPSKEQLLQSATYIATDTATKTAANVTTQVSEGVHKATRWFWWWSLAAVGVYGISTTLTKEGVQMIKDMFTSSSKKESLFDDTKGATAISVVSSGTVDSVNENKRNKKSGNSGRWLSSWFSLRASRDGQDDSSQ